MTLITVLLSTFLPRLVIVKQDFTCHFSVKGMRMAETVYQDNWGTRGIHQCINTQSLQIDSSSNYICNTWQCQRCYRDVVTNKFLQDKTDSKIHNEWFYRVDSEKWTESHYQQFAGFIEMCLPFCHWIELPSRDLSFCKFPKSIIQKLRQKSKEEK